MNTRGGRTRLISCTNWSRPVVQPSSLDHQQDGGTSHRTGENQDLQLKQFREGFQISRFPSRDRLVGSIVTAKTTNPSAERPSPALLQT